MSWLAIALLACAVGVLVAAEWPRLAALVQPEPKRRTSRGRRKTALRVVQPEDEEFAASVKRDLDRLPTYDGSRDRR